MPNGSAFSSQPGRRAVLAGGTALGLSGLPRDAQAARTRFVTANNNPYDILDPHQVFDIGRIAVRLNMYDALTRWVAWCMDWYKQLQWFRERQKMHLGLESA